MDKLPCLGQNCKPIRIGDLMVESPGQWRIQGGAQQACLGVPPQNFDRLRFFYPILYQNASK